MSATGKNSMRFCTVINCMDGRVQKPALEYLQKRFDVEHVDSITEAAPNLILSQQKRTASVRSILERLRISIENHNSVGVAVAGHHNCAGNPAPKDEQIIHIRNAMEFLRQHCPNTEMLGLWIDENWEVHEVNEVNEAK